MVLRRYDSDPVRDQETLANVRKARAAMDAMELAFFKEQSVPWAEVDKAREEFLVHWDIRRNFVLCDKYGMQPEVLNQAMDEFEKNRV